MAKVSAHGEIVGTVYFTAKAKRYMSDGAVLINNGFGWKLGKKLKTGITPLQAFENQKKAQADFLAANPEVKEYRRILHDLAGMSLRWKLHQCVAMMPDDCDGVWAECCDGYGDNISADFDEVAELCRAYLRVPMKTE